MSEPERLSSWVKVDACSVRAATSFGSQTRRATGEFVSSTPSRTSLTRTMKLLLLACCGLGHFCPSAGLLCISWSEQVRQISRLRRGKHWRDNNCSENSWCLTVLVRGSFGQLRPRANRLL